MDAIPMTGFIATNNGPGNASGPTSGIIQDARGNEGDFSAVLNAMGARHPASFRMLAETKGIFPPC